MKNSRLASWKTALPFLLPSLAGFVVFSIIPMIMQIFVSLTSWDGLSELTLFSDFSGFMDRFYVGIENYKEILTSKEFYQVIGKHAGICDPLHSFDAYCLHDCGAHFEQSCKGCWNFPRSLLYPGYHLMGCGRIDLEMGS